jgi:hypothetical protein
MNNENDKWKPDGDTSWMAPGVGVTATFDYEREGSGNGTHRVYKKNKAETQVAAENKRDQYLAMGFKCSPIVYRTGA